jgi:hypothetical protein
MSRAALLSIAAIALQCLAAAAAQAEEGLAAGAPVADPSAYTVCDAKCQRDVKLLEGFIVAVAFIMALSVGLFCMHSVDAPSRFPQPRDARSHHD